MSRHEIDVATWMLSRQENRGHDVNSNLGLGTLKSTAGYIGIRAQLGNPINTQLPKIVKQVAGEVEGEIWVARTSFCFSFLFFFFFLFLLFSSF